MSFASWRRSKWTLLLGLTLLVPGRLFAYGCPVPPPPGWFGDACPMDGSIGMVIVSDSGFTIRGDETRSPLPDKPHMWKRFQNGVPVEDYAQGRDLHFGNYRNECIIQGLYPKCSQQFVEAHYQSVTGCGYDEKDNLDGLRLCTIEAGPEGAYLSFRIKYTAKAHEPAYPLQSPLITFIVAKPGYDRLEVIVAPPVQDENQYLDAPSSPETRFFPVGVYDVQLTIEDSGPSVACWGYGQYPPLTIGETENYELEVVEGNAYLRTLGTNEPITATCDDWP